MRVLSLPGTGTCHGETDIVGDWSVIKFFFRIIEMSRAQWQRSRELMRIAMEQKKRKGGAEREHF